MLIFAVQQAFVISVYRYSFSHSFPLWFIVVVVQFLSHVWLFAARQASPSITNSQSFPKFINPTVSSCVPLFSFYQHQGIFNESDLCIRWPKYQNFSFIINPFNEYSELISLRIDWFDLFAVQGTLESLLQHHNLKALILQCSAFFMVQLSHPFMTTGKTIALTIQTFFSKVMPLLFNSAV